MTYPPFLPCETYGILWSAGPRPKDLDLSPIVPLMCEINDRIALKVKTGKLPVPGVYAHADLLRVEIQIDKNRTSRHLLYISNSNTKDGYYCLNEGLPETDHQILSSRLNHGLKDIPMPSSASFGFAYTSEMSNMTSHDIVELSRHLDRFTPEREAASLSTSPLE